MKKVALAIVFWNLATLAFSQDQREQRVLDLSRKKFDWLIQRNYDSLNNFLDDNILYIHSNGWVQAKMEIIEDLKSGKLNYQKVIIKESKVRLYPSSGTSSTAAVVTGLGTFEGITEGKPFAMDLRYTEVYVLSGMPIRWRLVSRHANRMP